MAYGPMRQNQAGCENRRRCPARHPTAIMASTAPTNTNCPISTPTLKNSKAIGMDDWQADLRQRAGKAESVQQAERERHDPRIVNLQASSGSLRSSLLTRVQPEEPHPV